MLSITHYKQKFQFYWGQKKYKLSLWGVSPHFDWKITRWVILILFVAMCVFGYVTYLQIDTRINADPEAAFYKKTRVNLQDMQKLQATFETQRTDFNAVINGN
jgi:hypothetical protein